ncbi:sugar ABC transporter ATP-binding protein [Kitasatospora sp. NBC_00240]|uniref:sugar ABC transporter ATP-binding protein n=1 Tax=Kitasatospora sp. NBC_00240 TaxID=2903567 RepID=UPI0022502EB4|nr:sugar ABC transporter ATP-binding protein [Kitasatospora sp. NBC_00240]MCX5215520.1 sugar ABC transporter ATP-binding protein [Kitasatospora sp. NBC_00240]
MTLSVRGGEVHGLVGGNGAGKSTLLRAVAGVVPVDDGRVLVDGTQVRTGSPREALRHGIALLGQEPVLVPDMTVLDNVMLGTWSHRAGLRSSRADRRTFDRLLSLGGFGLRPDTLVRDLSLVDRQQVEMLRALAHDARILVMDESTALLTVVEARRLAAQVRALANTGVAVVLASHHLDDVLGACDTVTVLREGRQVFTGPAREQTRENLVQLLTGKPTSLPGPEPDPVPPGAPVQLAVHALRPSAACGGVDFEVRAGEIVGITGMVGSGRSAVLRAVFGADRPVAGTVEVAGRPLRRASPAHAIRAGLVLVPESRAEQGLVGGRPVRENLALATLGTRQRAGFLRLRAEATVVAQAMDRLAVRGAHARDPVRRLSGGNQQKVLFGKWLLYRPTVLLADEPTRGVDVAAKAQIHELLVGLARQGVAVLIASSDIDEVITLSHRVLVMRQGRVEAAFARGSATRQDVIAAASPEGRGPAGGTA